MIDITKFFLKQFRTYLDKKHVDFEKMPKDKYWEEFNTWAEENQEDLLKQYHEAYKKFIYKSETQEVPERFALFPMVIKRYFSDDVFNSIKADFGFLIDRILQSGFEYDLQIRDNYFNLYYKGNSLGKISFSSKTGLYNIRIHHKFIDQRIKERFKPQEGTYLTFILHKEQLHPLFSQRNLASMSQKVKAVYFQEEVIFEQMIMTDNVDRKDFIIIDRQILDKTAKTKMDLLALVKQADNNYQFCVIEVKLGNNPELRGDVIDQLKGYIHRIEQNFEAYKTEVPP